MQFYAHGKLLHQERRELAALVRERIKSGSRDVLQNGHLTVPPLPPTNLLGCHLIRIRYSVCVSIRLELL